MRKMNNGEVVVILSKLNEVEGINLTIVELREALLILGKKGYFWMRGILLGVTDFLLGDRSGIWLPTYMK